MKTEPSLDAATKLAAAGILLMSERPYLATALWAVRRVACDAVGTMAVDRGWRLYYNPSTLDAWSVREVAGVLYHELCHLLREHAARGALFYDPSAWNLAADAEINDDLRAEYVRLPGSPIYPQTLGQTDGLLAEAYYAALRSVRLIVSGDGPAAGRCGSAAHGRSEPWEAPENGDGAVLPSIGLSEQMLIRHQVAVEIRRHQREGGRLAGHWARWAQDRLAPRIDWRRELAGEVRRAVADVAGAVDYRYDRPSRRQPCFGVVIMPSLRRPIPRLAVVVDTSGSMDAALLGTALVELATLLSMAAAREGVTVLAVDTAVQSCRRVFRAEQVQLIGGGGTDLGVGLAVVGRLRPRPQILVVLTDGWTAWPAQPLRGIATIVALLDPVGCAPSWARVVRLVTPIADSDDEPDTPRGRNR